MTGNLITQTVLIFSALLLATLAVPIMLGHLP
jgi:hypothetical protein